MQAMRVTAEAPAEGGAKASPFRSSIAKVRALIFDALPIGLERPIGLEGFGMSGEFVSNVTRWTRAPVHLASSLSSGSCCRDRVEHPYEASPRRPLETQLLMQLVERTKAVNVSLTRAGEVLKLKCPCGALILPPTPAIPKLVDHQRGMLKSKMERHLQGDHLLAATRHGYVKL
jgi:hypothetical protein